MKKRFLLVFLILIFSLIIIGCKKDDSLPEQITEDFNFSLQYGINGINEINTYENTITKDLILDGTKSIKFEIPKKDLGDVYSKLVELDIARISEKLVNKKLFITPLTEYILTFTISKRKYTVSGDATMYSLNGNEQVDDFSTFVKYVIDYVESTTEYKSLPEPEGGYD
jgi:hypothetical protein